MSIRAEEPADIAAIHNVVEQAFLRPLEAVLVDQLRAGGNIAISLVAVKDRGIVGHVLFSNLIAPFKALALAPASVAPDRRRSGIGSAMIREGLSRATDDGWRAVLVVGDPKYYRRFGFSPDCARGLTSPYSGPHFMLLALNGDCPDAIGKVSYATPFAALN